MDSRGKSRATVGIIGLGSFGAFVSTLIPSSCELLGYDQSHIKVDGVKSVSLERLMKADVVILAVPLGSYESLFSRLRPLLKPSTLLIDVCSVKTRPEQIMGKYFPSHKNILFSHPLFGPQSAINGTKGHSLVITGKKGSLADSVVEYCRNRLGLVIHSYTAKEHDQIMANVHVLTFFVGRGLSNLNVDDGPFSTPSHQMIMDLIALDHSHTKELFETIQLGNPYAAQMRRAVIASFNKLNDDLQKNTSYAKNK